MGSDQVIPPLPPGFKLDKPGAIPPPPPGFTLDAPEQAQAKPSRPDGPAMKFAKELGGQINPIEGIKGTAQLIRHPIDTLRADADQRKKIWDDAGTAFKGGDYGTAAAKGLYGAIPLVGPQLARSGDQFAEGEFAKGAGSSTGIGLNMAAPGALKGARARVPAGIANKLEGAARTTYQKMLKPSVTQGVNKTRAMAQTGLDERIPISERGLQKIGGLLDELNTKSADTIASSGPSRNVSPGKAVQNTRALETKFARQVNPESDLQAIGASRQEFLDRLTPAGSSTPRNMSAVEAQAMKTGTYNQLKSKAYGEMKSAAIETQKALARGIKEELEVQVPELKGVNTRISKLINLEKHIERAVVRHKNRNVVGIGGPIAATAAHAVAGGTAGAVTGLLHGVAKMTKGQLAFAISKAGKMSISAAKVRVAGYMNALGQEEDPEEEKRASAKTRALEARDRYRPNASGN